LCAVRPAVRIRQARHLQQGLLIGQLYFLALGRLSYDLRTRQYTARRTTEGKTKREIIRCIKRYLQRPGQQFQLHPAALQLGGQSQQLGGVAGESKGRHRGLGTFGRDVRPVAMHVTMGG
jgi:hypothetical protein